MLTILAQFSEGLRDTRLGLLAKLSPKGGSFDTYLSRFKSQGYIERNSRFTHITPAGLQAVGPVEALPTGDSLFQYWRERVGANSGAGRFLDVLRRAYPNAVSRQDLAQHAGIHIEGGSFDTYLSRIRALDLVTEP
jgi:hypothetical protein